MIPTVNIRWLVFFMQNKGESNLTKNELGQYIKLKKEISMLEGRISKLQSREVPEVAGKVQSTSKDFPWIPVRVSVQMYSPKINDEINRNIKLLEQRLERSWQQCREIEAYIDSIADSELRMIFQMRYIEGMKLREIAEQVNQDLSGIGKKITEYINLSNNSKNEVL